jgi:DNA-binding MarR family transcriptional regulator
VPSQPAAYRLEELRTAFDSVFAAQRRLRGRDAKVLDGISYAQFRLLNTLAREGPMPSSHLASTIGVSGPSTTQMLDALERRGMIERTRVEHDRRVVTVTVTAEGRRRCEVRRAAQQQVFERQFAGLREHEVTIGVDVLRRCAAFLDEL